MRKEVLLDLILGNEDQLSVAELLGSSNYFIRFRKAAKQDKKL